MGLFGKNLICTQDWLFEDLIQVLNLAVTMKNNRFNPYWKTLLESKTFLMFFYNYSLRTRISFETAMTELGGHAQFVTPSMVRLKNIKEAGESIEDVAKVMSRYAAGIGIRIAEGEVPYYGAGNTLIQEYARYATVPVINMADDRFHPCQGLADVLGWAEWYGEGYGKPNFNKLKKKNFLLTWAKGGMARTWSSVHETLLVASRFGMNITLARPEGYDLDPHIYQAIQKNCAQYNSDFYITDDSVESYDKVHVVYSRNWMSTEAYANNQLQREKEIEKAMSRTAWIATAEKMKRTDNAIFTHCMPIDRGAEVTDEVVNGTRSAVYDVAENRLHVQKALLALTMSHNLLC